MPLSEAPDMRLRRARQGIWEPHQYLPDIHWDDPPLVLHDHCGSCGDVAVLNILRICQPCNFQAKLPTISIQGTPWALAEVRRQYGHRGESSPSDQQKKMRRDALDDEWRQTHGLSVGEVPK